MRVLIAFGFILASAVAFYQSGSSYSRMAPVMLFGSKKKAAPAPVAPPKPATTNTVFPAANGGQYVPAGLTKEQYAKFLAEEAAKKAKKSQKFPLGKDAETLTEWMLKCEAKGLSGKDMLLKGHRMVKAKYDNFYTDESPV